MVSGPVERHQVVEGVQLEVLYLMDEGRGQPRLSTVSRPSVGSVTDPARAGRLVRSSTPDLIAATAAIDPK